MNEAVSNIIVSKNASHFLSFKVGGLIKWAVYVANDSTDEFVWS